MLGLERLVLRELLQKPVVDAGCLLAEGVDAAARDLEPTARDLFNKLALGEVGQGPRHSVIEERLLPAGNHEIQLGICYAQL